MSKSTKNKKNTKTSVLKRARGLKNQKGGTLVEFAVIAPLLFLILFGIIEFGILLYDKAMITNASREGARAGIVFNYPERITNDRIIEEVDKYLGAHLISFGGAANWSISITPNDRSASLAGDSLTVNVTYPFRFLFVSNLLAWTGNANLVNLRAETVMRLE
jgi:Flp pilus assembly protein TadG